MTSVLLTVNPLSASSLIGAFGAIGVGLVLFAETGLLVGFFLPGDSLLFTAGVFAAAPVQGVRLHLAVVLPLAALGAVLGAQTGWVIGRRAGPPLLRRPDSRLFRREYVERARRFLDRYGVGKAVVLGRFVPIVRTFLNPLVGVTGVPGRRFAVWNLVGGLLWTTVVLLLGYALGGVLPAGNIDTFLLPVVAGIVVLSLVPIAVEAVRSRRS